MATVRLFSLYLLLFSLLVSQSVAAQNTPALKSGKKNTPTTAPAKVEASPAPEEAPAEESPAAEVPAETPAEPPAVEAATPVETPAAEGAAMDASSTEGAAPADAPPAEGAAPAEGGVPAFLDPAGAEGAPAVDPATVEGLMPPSELVAPIEMVTETSIAPSPGAQPFAADPAAAPAPAPAPEGSTLEAPAPMSEGESAPKPEGEAVPKPKVAAPKEKAAAKPAASAEKAAPEAAPAPPPPAPIEEELAQINTRIKALDEEIAAIEAAQPVVEGQPPNPRLEYLKRARLLNQRRMSSLTRVRQLEEQLAPAPAPQAEPKKEAEAKEPEKKSAKKGDAKPEEPKVEYLDIQGFDVLLDQLDAAQRQLESETLALASQEQAAKRAKQFQEDAAKARRAAEEKQVAATAAGGGTAEFAALEDARREESLAELQAQVEDVLVRVKRLELQVAERGVTSAREAVVAGSARLRFTDESLQALVKATGEQRDTMAKSLNSLYRQREKDDEQLFKARQSANTAAPEAAELAKERVSNAELSLATTNLGIQNGEQRISNLNSEESAWTMRAAISSNTLEGSYARLLAETVTKLEVLRDSMAQAESRTRNALSLRLEIDRRLESPDLPTDLRTLLGKRIEAFDKQETFDREYLADLTRQEKLFRRLEWALRRGLEQQGYMAQVVRAREMMQQVWNYELFVFEGRGFTVSTLSFAVLAYCGTLFGLLFVRRRLHKLLIRVLTKRAGSDNATLRDVGLTFINGTNTLVLVVLSLWPSLRFLPLNESVQTILVSVFYLAILGQCAIYATNWIERTVNRHKMRRLKEDPSSVSAYGVMSFFARIAIWSVVVLITLASFDYDITGLMAGLGIGGVAVAFALQSILADIFSSVAILLDKPFMVGDVITVGTETGEIESIGLKTTRMKSVTGEQVVISNTDLLGSRIRNFKRMNERRVLFQIGVTYQTKQEHLEAIPGMLREIIESQEKVRFDRAHLKIFGDFALIFECVYFMTEPDYALYMDTNQRVHLELFRRFHDLGIEFAYPTQTLYVHMEGGAGPKPAIKMTAAETGSSGDVE
jgi:MscS family membrane protein